jgi:undecaprenyl diphosphate synthase
MRNPYSVNTTSSLLRCRCHVRRMRQVDAMLKAAFADLMPAGPLSGPFCRSFLRSHNNALEKPDNLPSTPALTVRAGSRSGVGGAPDNDEDPTSSTTNVSPSSMSAAEQLRLQALCPLMLLCAGRSERHSVVTDCLDHRNSTVEIDVCITALAGFQYTRYEDTFRLCTPSVPLGADYSCIHFDARTSLSIYARRLGGSVELQVRTTSYRAEVQRASEHSDLLGPCTPDKNALFTFGEKDCMSAATIALQSRAAIVAPQDKTRRLGVTRMLALESFSVTHGTFHLDHGLLHDTAQQASMSFEIVANQPELQIAVSRTFVSNIVNDGHMLSVAWPCSKLSTCHGSLHTLSVDSPDVSFGRLVSPTCTVTLREPPPWSQMHGRLRLHAPGDSVIIMLEPSNLATLWDNYEPIPGKALGPGMVALLGCRQPEPALSLTDEPPPSSLLVSVQLPRHIAVVMDGNGRWAKCRHLPRSEGHVAGVEAIHRMIRACRRLGISYLTLYAFSAQNWSRPPEEVKALMKLLIDFVHTDCEELIANGVRLLVNGDISRLPAVARTGLLRLIDVSRNNTHLTLCLALSYGGREEIVSAVANACRAAKAGHLDPEQLTLDAFRSYLPHPDVPDPDLLIRTSGELRISNFLLWQIAYTELYVTPVLWPDFGDKDLVEALREYARRERRFGKTTEQIVQQPTVPGAPPASCEDAFSRQLLYTLRSCPENGSVYPTFDTAPESSSQEDSPSDSDVPSQLRAKRQRSYNFTRSTLQSAWIAMATAAYSWYADFHRLLAPVRVETPCASGSKHTSKAPGDKRIARRSKHRSQVFSLPVVALCVFAPVCFLLLPVMLMAAFTMGSVTTAQGGSSVGSRGTARHCSPLGLNPPPSMLPWSPGVSWFRWGEGESCSPVNPACTTTSTSSTVDYLPRPSECALQAEAPSRAPVGSSPVPTFDQQTGRGAQKCEDFSRDDL